MKLNESKVMRMTGVEIYQFIKPHLGSINATGFHGTDIDNLMNFKKYDHLINCLLEDLDSSFSGSKNSYEDSVQRINAKVKEIMRDKYEWLKDYVEEFDNESQ